MHRQQPGLPYPGWSLPMALRMLRAAQQRERDARAALVADLSVLLAGAFDAGDSIAQHVAKLQNPPPD